jgi:aquaporin Z
MASRLRDHWPEYAIEAACLGLFLVAAVACATVIHHPDFAIRHLLPAAWARRVVMGAAMGLTVMAIIYSPAGARSGAHINPATTLTFWRLGKVHAVDAWAYATAQFAGALGGILVAGVVMARWIGTPEVRFVATIPGPRGALVAFVAEVFIALALMTVVLHVSNHARYSRYTCVCAGLLVWAYIVVEEPLSGMSLNPARSLAPALLAGDLDVLWVYLTAPPIGMLTAAELFVRRRGSAVVHCAKLHHATAARCIFHCRFGDLGS